MPPKNTVVIKPAPLGPIVSKGSEWPIHLTAVATIQPGAQSAPNSIALKCPVEMPMEILEIKWSFFSTAAVANSSFLSGGGIGCQLQLGHIALTGGFVPLFNFGSGEFMSAEEPTGTSFALANNLVDRFFRWKLPRPLYVPAGAVLVPTFFHRQLCQDTLTVRIGVSARILPKGKPPQIVNVPYVCYYASKSFAMSANDSDVSLETDLANQTGVDLKLQRMIGRMNNITPAGGGTFQNTEWNTTLTLSGGASASQKLITVQMIDSFGNPWIRDPTFFRQAFYGGNRCWDLEGLTLPANAFLVASIGKTASTSTSGADPQVQPIISMVGWRELDFSSVYS